MYIFYRLLQIYSNLIVCRCDVYLEIDHNAGSVLQCTEDVKLRCKIELESYSFSQISNSQCYLAKAVSMGNFKMNFKKEGGCASPIYDQIV